MIGYYGAFGMMSPLGGVVMVLFWIVVVLAILWAVQALFPSEHRRARAVALDLLERRYAAGEISAMEYEQARGALG
jgi:uncharacterized membrane protein